MIMFFTLIRCRGISFRKKVTVVIMIVEVVVILGLQMLFQDIAFMGLGATLQMFFLYFIIENPDLQIVNDLEKTQNSIDKSSKTKLEFLSNMSDEMNVPINEIIRYSKLNLNTSNFDQEKVKTNIRYMMKSGNNLLDIINNVLDMSTLESSDEVLNQREYSLYNLLKELTDFTKEKIGDKPISFVINVEENTPSIVYGDYSKLYQALLNVLSNAVKYTNVGKIMLTISCEYKNDTSIIKFVVTDTGEGIKEEDFDKVFTKYETADDTESNTKGATVGLVISKKHIELMGGEITFESNYGVGSTFYVSVPQKIINSSPIQNINELNNTTNNSIPFHDYSKYTVLVVDDDTLNLEVTRKLLEKNKINVETVKTGNECIYNIKSDKQYDLILMDDMMSEMTGIEVIHALKKLKEQDGYKVPPVVALTATVMTGVEEVYLNEGFNDYLPKPINASSLNKLISKYLNRNQI
jgi:signal transduction histidine kinase/ActR/RegA family two-component response regulator